MYLIRQGFISISRQWKKSLLLFLSVFLVGSLVAVALSVHNVILITETNLRRRIPPFATIIRDNDAIINFVESTGEWPELHLTAELIEAIGDLPYVREFDYSLRGDNFFSRSLRLSTDPTPYLDTFWGNPDGLEELLSSFSVGVEGIERLQVKGIANSLVLDIENEVIELIQGRIFTDLEMMEAEPVVLISQAFASANHLTVGSLLSVEQNIYDQSVTREAPELEDDFYDSNLISSIPVELEVIGIFRPMVIMDSETNFVEFHNHITLNSRIYTPIGVVKEAINFMKEPHFYFQDILFVLYDSLDLVDFHVSASEILPDFLHLYDLSTSFKDMTTSLHSLQDIADWILIGAIFAALVLLGLLLLLFLSDRKQEMGIYLGLGQKRRNVIFQFLLEVGMTSVLALGLSLFVGHFVASELSQVMLINELAINNTPMNLDLITGLDFNSMGLGFWMTHEEMLEAFDATLDIRTTLLFMGYSLLVIVLSTVAPVIYITRLNVKAILMKASLG